MSLFRIILEVVRLSSSIFFARILLPNGLIFIVLSPSLRIFSTLMCSLLKYSNRCPCFRQGRGCSTVIMALPFGHAIWTDAPENRDDRVSDRHHRSCRSRCRKEDRCLVRRDLPQRLPLFEPLPEPRSRSPQQPGDEALGGGRPCLVASLRMGLPPSCRLTPPLTRTIDANRLSGGDLPSHPMGDWFSYREIPTPGAPAVANLPRGSLRALPSQSDTQRRRSVGIIPLAPLGCCEAFPLPL